MCVYTTNMNTIKSYGKFSIDIDPKKSLTELLTVGSYDTIFFETHKLVLPVGKQIGETQVELELLSTTEETETPTEEEKIFTKQGYRPATLRELLTLGIQHPEIQKEILISTLGAIDTKEDIDEGSSKEERYWMICLYNWLDERVIYYAEYEGEHREKCFNVFVKEK